MNKNTKYSFWKLINEYGIKIPIIQRDYAQGRRNNEKDETVRENLLNSIFKALLDDTETIDLDFVYGTEVTVDQEVWLLPLDG